MKSSIAWSAVGMMCAFSPTARAQDDSSKVTPIRDSLSGTRGVVKESGHQVAITLHRGHATLVVRRTLWNWGTRHDQGEYLLAMPDWTVATGLRTKGMVQGKPVWFKADLMEAEAAAAKYQELTGIGGYYPKDPALLSWRNEDQLALQVFPLAPGAAKVIEYTLTMATQYHDGRDVLRLPRMGLPCHNPDLIIRAADATDRVWVNGQPFPQNGKMPWPRKAPAEDGVDTTDQDDTDDQDNCEPTDSLEETAPRMEEPLCAEQGADSVTIELRRSSVPTLGGRMAVQPVAKDKVLVHVQIETPAEFAPVPTRPSIVVLLDDSRSMNQRSQGAGAMAVRQVLSRMPDAQVAILAFSRHFRPVTKGFVPATTAIANLSHYKYLRDNGSEVDKALAKADALLAQTPAGGPRRVYLLSDLFTRQSLDPLKLRTVFKRSRAVLHIATIDEGDPQLDPNDKTQWSKVARATMGLAWKGSARMQSAHRESLARVFEEWVRPTRLFRWKMAGPDLDSEESVNTDASMWEVNELPTGIAIARLGIATKKPHSLKMRGELWSRPASATLTPNSGQARLWSGLAFRSALIADLSEDEQMVLAKRGHAVSPVTSYLAIEPGVRPSTEGLMDSENVLGNLIGNEIGSASGIGCLGIGDSQPFDHLGALRELATKAWATCGGAGQSASLTLENTTIEVVDVSAVKAPSKALGRCLREAAWTFVLPDRFSEVAQKTWELIVH
jgi:hypothetical protein